MSSLQSAFFENVRYPMTPVEPTAEKPRPWLRLAVLLMLGSAVFGGLPVWGLLYLSASKPEGQPLDVARARSLVVEKAALLAELRELVTSEAAAGAARQQELLVQLGALAVVGPKRAEGAVRLVFRRYGEPGAMHEQRLEWVPAVLATALRATPRVGESQHEELAFGWWWVQR